jgi:hypothetical protein
VTSTLTTLPTLEAVQERLSAAVGSKAKLEIAADVQKQYRAELKKLQATPNQKLEEQAKILRHLSNIDRYMAIELYNDKEAWAKRHKPVNTLD